MAIPRLHLFELADQGWFHPAARRCLTDYLNFIETRFSLERPVVPLLRDALAKTESRPLAAEAHRADYVWRAGKL